MARRDGRLDGSSAMNDGSPEYWVIRLLSLMSPVTTLAAYHCMWRRGKRKPMQREICRRALSFSFSPPKEANNTKTPLNSSKMPHSDIMMTKGNYLSGEGGVTPKAESQTRLPGLLKRASRCKVWRYGCPMGDPRLVWVAVFWAPTRWGQTATARPNEKGSKHGPYTRPSTTRRRYHCTKQLRPSREGTAFAPVVSQSKRAEEGRRTKSVDQVRPQQRSPCVELTSTSSSSSIDLESCEPCSVSSPPRGSTATGSTKCSDVDP